nr:uncharacterized protein LOC127309888 [Lolium perenne]
MAATNTTLPAPISFPIHSHPILSVHISTYVKFQVQSNGANFSKWRQIFTLLVTMYKVADHVTEGAAPANPSDDWLAVDIHISLWIMATLSDDLQRLVQSTDGRVLSTWTRLHRFFYDNQASRYLYLSKAFRNCPRGDLSITTYASKLQAIADDLAAIGRPVDESDLVLQFIDGLGKQYKLQAEILKGSGALPSFSDVCSRLQLCEVDAVAQQSHDAAQDGAQALAVHGDRGKASIPGVSPNYRGKNLIPGFQHPNQSGGQRGNFTNGRGRGRDAFDPRAAPPAGRDGGGQQPWLGYFAPMGMPFPPPRSPWISPNSSGVLGARPGVPTQAYAALPAAPHFQPAPTYPAPAPAMHQQPQYLPPQYQPPSWDHNSLLMAAPSYGSAFPAQGGDWIMDSGATSHVTGTQDSLSLPLALLISPLDLSP